MSTSWHMPVSPATGCSEHSSRATTLRGRFQLPAWYRKRGCSGSSHFWEHRWPNMLSIWWTPLRGKYDDGGFSCGNTDRPALQRLLEDVQAGSSAPKLSNNIIQN